jgi:hypothetical protein
MTLLMRQLGEPDPQRFGHEDLDEGWGRIQLDVLTRIYWQGSDHRMVLSLLAGDIGEETVLKVWDDADLKRYGAERWHRTGHRQRARGRLVEIDDRDDLVQDLRHTLIDASRMAPEGFSNSILSLPTTLFFPAYRDIPPVLGIEERPIIQPEHWGYRSAQEFAAHGTHWTESLDNLLVWLAWLNNGSYEDAVKTVNETVFGKSPGRWCINLPPAANLAAVPAKKVPRHVIDSFQQRRRRLAQAGDLPGHQLARV